MSNEIAEISPEIINSLILTGDMSKLTPNQQTQYYTAVCKSIDINPLTQPFAIIVLQNKKTLYATKGCTQQLSSNRKINTEITKRETLDGVYIAYCRATMTDGRFTDDDGAVSIVGLKGAELANAMMKAVTKAKRRAVLALCGLGMPDETEIEDIRDVSSNGDQTKSRLDNIIDAEHTNTETVDAPKEQESKKESEIKKSKSKPKDTEITGQKKVKGVIDTSLDDENKPIGIKINTVMNQANGKEGVKHSFKIENKFYGTFDTKIGKEILNIIDIGKETGTPILLEIVYTERIKGDKTFQDIVSFRQCEMKDIPI